MRKRTVLLVALVVSALLAGVLGVAVADDERRKKARVDRAIEALEHELAETSQEMRAAGIALRRAEAKLPGAKARVAEVRGRLAAAQARDRALGERLEVAKAEVARARREIAATQAEVDATQSVIGRIARSSYQQGGYGEIAVVLDAESPDDFAARLVMIKDALRSQGGALAQLAEDRADLAAKKATLDAKKAQIAAMKREQERLVLAIQELERQAVAAQQAVEKLIAERALALAAIEREKAREERRQRAMEAESRRLQRVLAERARQARIAAAREAARRRAAGRSNGGGGGGGGGGFTPSGNALSYPVNAGVTSSYGMRKHPVTGVYKLHDGTDFGAGCGTPVHAAASGTVVWASLLVGYGNQLAIDHGAIRGSGVSTSYSHLSRFAKSSGSHVSRGEVIGYSGGGAGMYGAGFSTGCHLHFMVYRNGGTTNPMGWL